MTGLLLIASIGLLIAFVAAQKDKSKMIQAACSQGNGRQIQGMKVGADMRGNCHSCQMWVPEYNPKLPTDATHLPVISNSQMGWCISEDKVRDSDLWGEWVTTDAGLVTDRGASCPAHQPK